MPSVEPEGGWFVELQLDEAERKFLSQSFPIELEITEWLDDYPSKIDNNYFDVCWEAHDSKTKESAMFLAFMPKSLFASAFSGIGKEPEEYCQKHIRIKLLKHDEPDNIKSHSEWGCWLEVIEAKFLAWSPDEENL